MTNGSAPICYVGKDVAKVLGYRNTRKALMDHVEAEDKVVTFCDSLGGKQMTAIVNESGLYALILSSKLPKAREFKHWVTSDAPSGSSALNPIVHYSLLIIH